MKQDISTIRHSTAHVMAASVKKLFPETKLGIGPVVESGFYYDFDSPHRFSEADFQKIEGEMLKIKKQKIPFEKIEKKIDEAIKLSKDAAEPYKNELISDLKTQGETKVSFYKTGDFIDLCRGPHVNNSSEIGEFKLLSVAGAYWKGSEKNKMLQRIYATDWQTKDELEKYLKMLERAKESDHRKIGKDLELFLISEEVGQGLPLWLPKGTTVRRQLENFVLDLEIKADYEHVSTPHLGKLDLYKTSGHWQHYKDLMYSPISIEDEKYLLRAMNCPHHIVIYKSKPRSYKDLPLRIAEEGTVYRFEKSGELTGLSRVRAFTINDAHIFCTQDQIPSEIKNVLELIKKLYKAVGFSQYRVVLALRDPKDKEKYVAGDKMWQTSEEALEESLKKINESYEKVVGEAAFYGPKIDVQAKDALGREFTISTVQLDFYLPKRFNLEYTNDAGEKVAPVIIHRALIGSFERFFAFLIEHHAGKFPVWLSPIQVAVLPIAERHNEYAEQISRQLKEADIRVKANLRNETLQAKIREAEIQKIPCILVVGDREQVTKKVSFRSKEGSQTLDLADFVEKIKKEISKERDE